MSKRGGEFISMDELLRKWEKTRPFLLPHRPPESHLIRHRHSQAPRATRTPCSTCIPSREIASIFSAQGDGFSLPGDPRKSTLVS